MSDPALLTLGQTVFENNVGEKEKMLGRSTFFFISQQFFVLSINRYHHLSCILDAFSLAISEILFSAQVKKLVQVV